MTSGVDRALGPLNVSRETLDKLERYTEHLTRWNTRINIVSARSLEHVWTRHIADTAQLYSLAPKGAGRWVDLGSGGGLPGLVAAILADGDGSATEFVLVEADRRKSAFLRSAARACGISVRVISERAEDIPPLDAHVLSARALAPLSQLLVYAERHLAKSGTALFPKGVKYRDELKLALESWQFRCEEFPSRTEPGAVLLGLGDIRRA